MNNNKTAINLIDQMIERAQQDDEQFKKRLIKENKACQTVGESWMVFHLKTLKSLIETGDEWYTM